MERTDDGARICHAGPMPNDDKLKKGLDRTFIGFGKEYEVRFWCNSLGCTQNALRAAVRAVGNSADAVRTYLKKK
jgi:hypothetical protein